MKTNFIELIDNLLVAFEETFLMCGISLGLSIVVGIPLGLFIFLTSDGLFWQNKVLNIIGEIGRAHV